MSAQVAIAVVSWNTRELLDACLRALEPDVRAGLAEVHVVDNGSSDGSAALVREAFGWAKLDEPGENLGYGRAVNRVAGRTETPWIVAANADAAPEPRALARLLEAGRATGAGAVAPRLILPDGSTQHSVYGFPTLPYLLAFNAGLYRLVPGLADRMLIERRWDPERARRVPWAIGAFLALRREAFDAAGGFDPAQWMYAEDLDLGWRLKQAGWQTHYEPAARVRHASGAAARQAFGERPYERWMDASYDWIERRRGRTRRIAAAALNVAGAAARRDRIWTRVHMRGLSAGRDARRAEPTSRHGRGA
jgi:N-acetylglucosaminyl-diphospho-decaprenol L-rhamnosyltransferase